MKTRKERQLKRRFKITNKQTNNKNHQTKQPRYIPGGQLTYQTLALKGFSSKRVAEGPPPRVPASPYATHKRRQARKGRESHSPNGGTGLPASLPSSTPQHPRSFWSQAANPGRREAAAPAAEEAPGAARTGRDCRGGSDALRKVPPRSGAKTGPPAPLPSNGPRGLGEAPPLPPAAEGPAGLLLPAPPAVRPCPRWLPQPKGQRGRDPAEMPPRSAPFSLFPPKDGVTEPRPAPRHSPQPPAASGRPRPAQQLPAAVTGTPPPRPLMLAPDHGSRLRRAGRLFN